ncbi:MAG: glucose-1-phosphate cytidylyltransferase [Candidatus Omnitrophota bacterium]
MKNKNMDVVILCGGMGTRLREETEVKPKPMVEIGGKPILWHIMKHYSHFGLNRFILALGYKGEYIKKYFYDYGLISSDFTITLDPKVPPKIHTLSTENHWEITCVDTGVETLKGARIKKLEPFIKSGYFHLTYGDGLSNVDLNRIEAFHKKHGKIGTVTAVRPPSRFGEMAIKGDRVKEFEEKPQLTTGYINGGFFVLNRDFLGYLTADDNCDFEFGSLQDLSRKGELMAYKHDGYWQCMDTARDVLYLNKLWNDSKAPWKVWAK